MITKTGRRLVKLAYGEEWRKRLPYMSPAERLAEIRRRRGVTAESEADELFAVAMKRIKGTGAKYRTATKIEEIDDLLKSHGGFHTSVHPKTGKPHEVIVVPDDEATLRRICEKQSAGMTPEQLRLMYALGVTHESFEAEEIADVAQKSNGTAVDSLLLYRRKKNRPYMMPLSEKKKFYNQRVYDDGVYDLIGRHTSGRVLAKTVQEYNRLLHGRQVVNNKVVHALPIMRKEDAQGISGLLGKHMVVPRGKTIYDVDLSDSDCARISESMKTNADERVVVTPSDTGKPNDFTYRYYVHKIQPQQQVPVIKHRQLMKGSKVWIPEER